MEGFEAGNCRVQVVLLHDTRFMIRVLGSRHRLFDTRKDSG